MSRATWSTRAGRRDRLPRGRAWEPVPVPALEDVRQVRDNAGAEAEPAGEALRDLAVQGERRARDLERVLERVGDHLLTNLRRSSLSHHVHEERAELFGVASVDECELGARLDVVPEELRLLGRVRRAAERVQQGDVVGVDELRRREPGELAEADREDRRPERVLERLTGAQIGRYRHRADHLRGADGRLAPRRSRGGWLAAAGCHGLDPMPATPACHASGAWKGKPPRGRLPSRSAASVVYATACRCSWGSIAPRLSTTSRVPSRT